MPARKYTGDGANAQRAHRVVFSGKEWQRLTELAAEANCEVGEYIAKRLDLNGTKQSRVNPDYILRWD